jgi:hypothetical protein
MVPYTDQQSKNFYHNYFIQRGSGLDVYEGYTTMPQIGGGFFSGFFKKAMPVIANVAKKVGKSALRTGLSLAEDAIQGDQANERETFSSRAKKRLANEGVELLRDLNPEKKKKKSSKNPKRRRIVI